MITVFFTLVCAIMDYLVKSLCKDWTHLPCIYDHIIEFLPFTCTYFFIKSKVLLFCNLVDQHEGFYNLK